MVLYQRYPLSKEDAKPRADWLSVSGYRVCQAPWALGSGQREGAGLLEMGSVAVRVVLSSGSVA